MSAFGVAFIGNIWALTMFGVGLLLRGYSTLLFNNAWFASIIPGGDITKAYVPHGMMVGAGIVALIQVGVVILRAASRPTHAGATRTRRPRCAARSAWASRLSADRRGDRAAGRAGGAASIGMLALFLVYAAFAALVHELIVGLAAMHSGWFPAFAVALITLVIGMLIGFPPVALALLVGFSAATGPAFADMGYDLKAGYMLRGYGSDPAFERDGRRQQLFAAMFAFVIADVVVLVAYPGFFAQNLVAPVDRVYVATIKAGASADVAWQLADLGDPRCDHPIPRRPEAPAWHPAGHRPADPVSAGGLGSAGRHRCRSCGSASPGAEGMEVFGAGVIAGDALFAFFTSTWKAV